MKWHVFYITDESVSKERLCRDIVEAETRIEAELFICQEHPTARIILSGEDDGQV